MEPTRAGTEKGADKAPETVTGFFIGSVAGYRLMVGWMATMLLLAASGIYLVCERLRILTVAVEALSK